MKTSKVAEIQVSYRPAISNKPVIRSSLDAFVELIEFFPPETIALQERFMVGYLNISNRLLGVYQLSVGGASETVVDIRLILSVALKSTTKSIILCHNHPSGNLRPSNHDIDMTRKIKEAAAIFSISVDDHIIVVPERKYLSFQDEGLI